jgi:hypothetical protein
VETDDVKTELLDEKDVKKLREQVSSLTAGFTELIDLQLRPTVDANTWKG